VDLPPADEKVDPNFGKMRVYHDDFTRVVKLPACRRQQQAEAHRRLPGLQRESICYPRRAGVQSGRLIASARRRSARRRRKRRLLPFRARRRSRRRTSDEGKITACSKAAITGWW